MRLGELIDTLEKLPSEAEVRFDTGDSPKRFDSWRGVYAQLTLIRNGSKRKTVGQLLAEARAADGGVFKGYKGGDFTMDRDTPVWADDYGECVYNALIGARMEDGKVVLATANIEAYRDW